MTAHDANKKANIRKAFLLSQAEVEMLVHVLRSKAGDEQSSDDYRQACAELADEFASSKWPVT